MSALSSATSTRGRERSVGAAYGCAWTGRSARAGSGESASWPMPSGSQRSASSRNGAPPVAVDDSCREASIRSGGKCALPVGIRTSNTEPCAEPLFADVQVRELLDEREADARPLVRPRPRLANAMEALEEPRQLVLRDADASVA